MRRHRQYPGIACRSGRGSGPDSFTLVEVVMAIAVVAFGLISVLGLMAYTSQLVHQADNYTRLSNVSSQVLARLGSQAYSVTSSAVTTNATYYFTFEGLPTNNSAGAAYYQCNITNVSPSPWALTAMMQIQLRICWPMTNGPNAQFRNTNVIITSTLNYD